GSVFGDTLKYSRPLWMMPKKLRLVIESIPAKHGATSHALQIRQLIQHEFLESVGLPSHKTIQTGLHAATIRTAIGSPIADPRRCRPAVWMMRCFASACCEGLRLAHRF